MVTRRKGGRTPFEVMSNSRPGSTGADDAPPSAADASGEGASPTLIVLRIPQGYAILLALGLLTLLTMAYLIGHARGQRQGMAAEREHAAQLAREAEAAREIEASIVGDGRGSASASAAPGDGSSPPVREPGLNYLILALLSDEANARALVDFLAEHGVEATIDPVHNGRFHVVDLRGFKGSELRSEAFAEYKQMLRRLGRKWKNEAGGVDDLSSMYPKRYDG